MGQSYAHIVDETREKAANNVAEVISLGQQEGNTQETMERFPLDQTFLFHVFGDLFNESINKFLKITIHLGFQLG